jgi:hypothetical protein
MSPQTPGFPSCQRWVRSVVGLIPHRSALPQTAHSPGGRAETLWPSSESRAVVLPSSRYARPPGAGARERTVSAEHLRDRRVRVALGVTVKRYPGPLLGGVSPGRRTASKEPRLSSQRFTTCEGVAPPFTGAHDLREKESSVAERQLPAAVLDTRDRIRDEQLRHRAGLTRSVTRQPHDNASASVT